MGFKSFCLCDPRTGYFKDFVLYIGSATVEPKHGLTIDVVLTRVETSGLGFSKRCIVADNYYSSPLLCILLANRGIWFLGTCRPNRKQFPSNKLVFPCRESEVKRWEFKVRFCDLYDLKPEVGHVMVTAVAWKDN